MADLRLVPGSGAPAAQRPLRLLFVVNVAWFFISHRLALAVAARDAGYDVHIATTVTSAADRQRIVDAGLTLHELSVRRGGLQLWSDMRGVVELSAIMRALRPDLLHLVTLKPILIGGALGRWYRVPAVVVAVPGLGYAFFARGLWARLRRRLVLWGLKFVTSRPRVGVILQNADDCERLVAAGCFAADVVELIQGSGVDLADYPPVAEPSATDGIRVVLPGRMLREKGIYEFVAAGKTLRERGLAVHMLLAGRVDTDNPGSVAEAELERWTQDGVVTWLGHRDDMHALLASAHIVCLPSYGEGMPKALLEAAAIGRAIVTTDVPGCRDAVDGGSAGVLVAARDAAALTDALAALAVDAGRRARLGAAAHALAVARFSLAGVVHRTLALYRRLLDDRRGQR